MNKYTQREQVLIVDLLKTIVPSLIANSRTWQDKHGNHLGIAQVAWVIVERLISEMKGKSHD